MTPEMASELQNQEIVWQHQESNDGPMKISKLKVGDEVRISKYKNAFRKGYLANWSEEIFKITYVDQRFTPPMYAIEDEKGNAIIGKFYSQELQKVSNPDKTYPIERILKRQGKRFLVKFIGYPDTYWVDRVYKQS
jgi:hypothetical protein